MTQQNANSDRLLLYDGKIDNTLGKIANDRVIRAVNTSYSNNIPIACMHFLTRGTK